MIAVRHLPMLLTVLTVLIGLAACAPPEPVRVGYIGGLSDRVSDLGIGGLQGVRLAVELRNKAGGIKGRPIELIESDDQQTADIAVQAFDSLVERHVLAVVGPMTSSMAMAIVPRANAAKMLIMSPTVTTGDLLGIDDYFFRVIPATQEFVRTNAEYYYQVLGLRRVRLVFDIRNRSYSQSWLDEFSKSFSATGGTLLTPLPFTSSEETAFSTLARQALADRPDGIVLVANSVDAAMMSQAIRRLDTRVAVGTSEWAATERLVEIGGKWTEGITVAQFFERDGRMPTYVTFRNAFISRFNREPGFPETFSYDAANVIFDALAARQGNQTIKQAILARRHFVGAQRPIDFDDYGDTQGKTFMVGIRNGAFVPIKH
ncbi:ABC transporter substrate-binding protein [Propionivibrio dicarboxylicus]|uniref:Branched-chain amino acid transport system substrate-binding protein n=1 Tax=Propionivibrio dicarboxylicus TaxID=83767 RepID=A0A1G8KDH0_9RHOO|nr:ABC transporter substrate-binding protein [Propionivibrio dicarboxylicus]SDI40880.1 branched-chain amino acid transport system substrate-binding protein [Propionivibrio dicarboxylicus]